MTSEKIIGDRGFTLVEALVVLVITGLLALTAVQGLGIILGSRSSMSVAVDRLQPTILTRAIIVDPLSGVIPDYKDKPNVFVGNQSRIRGMTTRPVNGIAGAPRPFQLRFSAVGGGDATALIYTNDRGQDFELDRWPGQGGRFSYRDISGPWVAQWPLPQDDTAPQTPWLIRLDTGNLERPTIVVYVASPHDRRFRIQDVGLAGVVNAQ